MKLNKTLGILSTLSLGIIPTLTKADLFQCLACPAGTYGNGTSTSCTPCPAGQYQNATGQSSCKPCNGIVNDSKTGCINIGDLTLDNFTQIASGSPGSASCPTGTLQPGWYLVRLRGGAGGKGIDNFGKSGTPLQYVFYLPLTSSYILCSGGDGENTKSIIGGDGGGGGSWVKLNFGEKDYYFVAGGGGAGGSMLYSPFGISFYIGGGGGGIGAGGGGGGTGYGANGGRSGPYTGGKSVGGGQGLINGNDGLEGLSFETGGSGGGGGGGSSSNSLTSPITINIINGYKTTKTITQIFGGIGGGGGEVKFTSTSGTSSHTSNVPKIPSCGSSCAILYKMK